MNLERKPRKRWFEINFKFYVKFWECNSKRPLELQPTQDFRLPMACWCKCKTTQSLDKRLWANPLGKQIWCIWCSHINHLWDHSIPSAQKWSLSCNHWRRKHVSPTATTTTTTGFLMAQIPVETCCIICYALAKEGEFREANWGEHGIWT